MFVQVADPVGSGFVSSLPHPGANITGFANFESSLGGKWIELLKEIVPRLTGAALLFNPDTAPFFSYYLPTFQAAARASALEPSTAEVHSIADVERTVAGIGGRPNTGLVVTPDIFTSNGNTLNALILAAARNRVPTIYPFRYMVTAGGLVSYGLDNADLYRRAADNVDRILKGANPIDLPVQLPTQFELAVNLKTAKALGLTIPGTVIARADEVIEWAARVHCDCGRCCDRVAIHIERAASTGDWVPRQLFVRCPGRPDCVPPGFERGGVHRGPEYCY